MLHCVYIESLVDAAMHSRWPTWLDDGYGPFSLDVWLAAMQLGNHDMAIDLDFEETPQLLEAEAYLR